MLNRPEISKNKIVKQYNENRMTTTTVKYSQGGASGWLRTMGGGADIDCEATTGLIGWLGGESGCAGCIMPGWQAAAAAAAAPYALAAAECGIGGLWCCMVDDWEFSLPEKDDKAKTCLPQLLYLNPLDGTSNRTLKDEFIANST